MMRKLITILFILMAFSGYSQFESTFSQVKILDSLKLVKDAAAGKVLTSDVYGVATWQDAQGGLSDVDQDSSYYVRDSTNWISDKAIYSNEYSLQPDFNFVYWKKDFINAIYKNDSKANMVVIADSYGTRYVNELLKYTSDKYGYVGGYQTFYSDVDYTDNYSWRDAGTNWVYGLDRADTLNPHNRYVSNLTTTNEIFLSAKRFNFIKLAYKQHADGGSITVRVGTNGVPDTINTSGSAALKWYYEDWGDVVYKYGTDTVFIKSIIGGGGKENILYGYDLGFNQYTWNSKYNGISIHMLNDGGARGDYFYAKNRAAMITFYDTLDASLACQVLGTNNGLVAETYTMGEQLIDSLRSWKTEMDMCIIIPHDEQNGRNTNNFDYLHRLAINKQAGLINTYNQIGNIDTLNNAGMTVDNTHLYGDGFYLPMMTIADKLYYPSIVVSDLKTENIFIQNDGNIFRNNEAFLWLDSIDNSNANLFIGNAGSKNTTGIQNCIIGFNSALGMTEGTYNTILGISAGTAIGTNKYNTFLGAQTGNSNLSNENVAIGYRAAREGTSFYKSVFVGARSGQIANDPFITAVGYQSGYSGGEGGVYIGNSAGYSETTANKLYIENSNSATPLIHGDFAADTLRINGDLSVSGAITAGSATHLFYYYGDSTISLSYTTAWQHLTNTYGEMWIYDESDGFTVSGDTITVTEAGDYDFTVKNVLDGDNGEVVSMRLYNVTQAAGIPVAGAATMRSSGNYNSITVLAYYDCVAGDKIVIQYKGDANGTSVFKNGIIKIYKVHN